MRHSSWGVLVAGACAALAGGACGGSNHAGAGGGGGVGASGGSTAGSGGTSGTGGSGPGGIAGGVGCEIPAAATNGDPTAATRWSRPFTISRWLPPDMWDAMSSTVAVDSAGLVYLSDLKSIYVADTAGVRVLYPASQLAQDIGTADYTVGKIDFSADGRLFAVIDITTPTPTSALYAADGQGHLRLFRDFKSFWPNRPTIAVVSADAVLVPFDKLYCVTSAAMAPLFGARSTQTPPVTNWDDYNCSGRTIATEAGGSFFYFLPGCTGSPLVGGRSDGSGLSVIWNLQATGDFPTLGLWTIGRAPHGGVIANLEKALYYVDDATHMRLNVTPAMEFTFSVLAVGPNDTIYILDGTGVYRAVPQT
jgi:hypothetical protein